jgi:integrase
VRVRVYQRPGSPYWYTDIRVGGRRTRRSCGTTDKQEAREVAARLHAEAVLHSPERRPDRTFYEALVSWLTMEERSATEKSIIRRIRAEYPDRPIADVTDESLRLAFPAMSAGNWNRYLSVLTAALRQSHDNHGTPLPKLKKRRNPPGRLRFLTHAEWLRLRAHLPAHMLPMVEFSLATGLRQANVLTLRWDELAPGMKSATVMVKDRKGRKPLTIPLSKWARDVLKARIGQHPDFVFTYAGKRLGSPKKGFASAVKAAGIKPITWHGLRHTWASWQVMAGTPLKAVQELGGWASLDIVMVYAHLAPSALAQYAEAVKAPGAQSRGTTARRPRSSVDRASPS